MSFWLWFDRIACIVGLLAAFALQGCGVWWYVFEEYSRSAALFAFSFSWFVMSFRAANNLGWK